MILKLLLNIQMIWIIFIKILKNAIKNNPKILIVFDDMITDVLSIKNLSPIVSELFMRGRKLNISLVFITQSFFAVPKSIRLNSTYCFIMNIPENENFSKLHLMIHQILTFKTLMNLYKNVLPKHIRFKRLIQLLPHIIFYISEKLF